MTRFYLGQRVRVIGVSDAEDNFLIGQEGVVNELDCVNELDVGGQVGVTVAGDDDWCFETWHLEPLTAALPARRLASWLTSAGRGLRFLGVRTNEEGTYVVSMAEGPLGGPDAT
jgi:hypothetical protein